MFVLDSCDFSGLFCCTEGKKELGNTGIQNAAGVMETGIRLNGSNAEYGITGTWSME